MLKKMLFKSWKNENLFSNLFLKIEIISIYSFLYLNVFLSLYWGKK